MGEPTGGEAAATEGGGGGRAPAMEKKRLEEALQGRGRVTNA